MGWTSYHAEFYKNGTVDRKKEIDKLWTQAECKKYPELNVLKSRMIGSTYYGAIEEKEKGIVKNVFAVVVLTSINMKDYFNFSYKEMDESAGPYCYDCPKGILDLLTETDNEYAINWRNKCRENIQKKKEKLTKGTLPVGSIIKLKKYNGEYVILQKMSPMYQFRRAWWYCAESNTYYPLNHIPDEFEIIKKGA